MADLLQLGYNAETTKESTGFKAYPTGDYAVVATEKDLIQKREEGKAMLKVTFEIIEGEFKGRKIFNNFNLVHPNPNTQGWARSDLKSWNAAMGQPNNEDSNELLNKPCIIHVKCVKKNDAYSDEDGNNNEIKGYKPYGAGVATTQAAPQQAAPAGNAPAWANQGK